MIPITWNSVKQVIVSTGVRGLTNYQITQALGHDSYDSQTDVASLTRIMWKAEEIDRRQTTRKGEIVYFPKEDS